MNPIVPTTIDERRVPAVINPLGLTGLMRQRGGPEIHFVMGRGQCGPQIPEGYPGRTPRASPILSLTPGFPGSASALTACL